MCCCNFAMGMCKCEPTKDGGCITCTSGDPCARDDSGRVRVHDRHDPGRLRVLHLHEQHAGVLQLLIIRSNEPGA